MSKEDTEKAFRHVNEFHLWDNGKIMPEHTVCVTNEYNYSYFTNQGKVDSMNLTTAIFLINEDVRALYVRYSKDQGVERTQRYMAKTFDKEISVGDTVVIGIGGDGFAVAIVEHVDVDVDFDSTTPIPWVVQRLNMAAFNDIVDREQACIRSINAATALAKKKKLAAELAALTEVKRLPLAKETPESGETPVDVWDMTRKTIT